MTDTMSLTLGVLAGAVADTFILNFGMSYFCNIVNKYHTVYFLHLRRSGMSKSLFSNSISYRPLKMIMCNLVSNVA